jgi:hypothetical protein
MAVVVVQRQSAVQLPTTPKITSFDWRAGMGMIVQEVYNPQRLTANTTAVLVNGPCAFGGFLCTAAGTFSLQDANGAVLIDPVALSVTQFLPAGFVCGNGAKVVLSGGCAGTALYAPSIS